MKTNQKQTINIDNFKFCFFFSFQKNIVDIKQSIRDTSHITKQLLTNCGGVHT